MKELWLREDDGVMPSCETGEGCPLAAANFPEDAPDELIEATMAGCRCQDESFLALFERSSWFYAASIYLADRDAGVANSPETLNWRTRFAVMLLHQKLETAKAEYQEHRIEEGKQDAD